MVRIEGEVESTSRLPFDADTETLMPTGGGTGFWGGWVGLLASSVEQPKARITPRASATVRNRVRAFI
jgi:hypothetical protein